MTVSSRLKEIKDRISAAEYRLTPQREVILKLLAEQSCAHLSAEEIYDLVRRTNPEIGLATVYRTVEMLSELKVIHSIDFGDGRLRYEFTDEDKHAHHHLICTRCGRVTEVGEDLLEKLEQSIEGKHGFRITDHQVKLYGVCKECLGR